MAVPYKHAESSARIWGGTPEEYLPFHRKMDCSKGYFPDNRHRALTHTMFWVLEVMVPLFGDVFVNSVGRKVSVKDICELHILEDYNRKFIPTPQDFLEEVEKKSWMDNGLGTPPSSAKKTVTDGTRRTGERRQSSLTSYID